MSPNLTLVQAAAKVGSELILLKNSQNWTSDFSAKYTLLRKLIEDCRDRFQRDATGLGTLLLPGPSPKFFRCIVRGNIFQFWTKSEFFNRISAEQTCFGAHIRRCRNVVDLINQLHRSEKSGHWSRLQRGSRRLRPDYQRPAALKEAMQSEDKTQIMACMALVAGLQDGKLPVRPKGKIPIPCASGGGVREVSSYFWR